MAALSAPNGLLSALSTDDRALLAPDLEPVTLSVKHEIEKPNVSIPHVYFPEAGIVSIVAKSADGREIEAGIIGREGMTGLPVVLGNHCSPHETYVQVAGSGERISAEKMRSAIAMSGSLHRKLLQFAQVFMTQVTQTALANGRAKIEERLARWLLMAQDRLDSNDVSLTHEFLALMLGVRRPGVTDALNALERKGLVRSNRGAVRIINREGLVRVAGGSYGVPEAEYERLIGSSRA